MVNKRVQHAVLGCNLKTDIIISVHFQGKPFNITVNRSLCPSLLDAREAEVDRSFEDLQDLLEHPKMMSFSSQGNGMQKLEVKGYLE